MAEVIKKAEETLETKKQRHGELDDAGPTGSTSEKISPGPEGGLLKRVQSITGIRYETLISWRKRGVKRSSHPVRLLWAVLDVLADDGTLSLVLERARKMI